MMLNAGMAARDFRPMGSAWTRLTLGLLAAAPWPVASAPMILSDPGRPEPLVGFGIFIIFLLLATVAALAVQSRRRLRAERRARRSRQRYELLANNMSDVLWVLNLSTRRLEFVTPSVHALVGYSVSEVLAHPRRSGIQSETFAHCKAIIEGRMQEQLKHPGEMRSYTDTIQLEHRDGDAIWTETVTHFVFNERDDLSLIGVTRDVTQRTSALREINQLAFYDSLTQLPNRKLLQDRMQQALADSARHGTAGALLCVDLDQFKTLNDTQGHAAGDDLLKQAAERLSCCVRDADTVARLGGDEFVIFLATQETDLHTTARMAQTVALNVLNAFRQDFELAGCPHRITASIGLSLFHGSDTNHEELLQRADLAMYRAKADGRDTFRFFDPEMQAAVSERARVEVELRRAIQADDLVLHYQAQVDPEGRVVGAEALVRWIHPQQGLQQPVKFIALAEETGLILGLGHWVLEAACQTLRRWSADVATAHLSLAVNVSARQFKRPDFVDQIEELLQREAVPPNRLKIELTESVLLDDVEETIAKMHDLRQRGIRFSLDDFGTGYSSMSYLKRLPLNQIKIDRSFIRDVLIDSHDATIARTIIGLGHSLGFQVIAEGVETTGQQSFLVDNGCMLFQGYLFSKPLPLVDFERVMVNGGVLSAAEALV